MQTIFGMISGILGGSTLIFWHRGVRYGTVRPHRVTWFIATFLQWSLFFSSLASGADSTIYWIGISSVCNTFIFIFSLTRGTWEMSWLDISCFVLGVLGVLLWILTSNPAFGVFISVTTGIIAIIPTYIKTWNDPTSEPIASWAVGCVGTFINLLAIDSSHLTIVIPPATVFVEHFPVLIPLILYRRALKRQQETQQ